MMDRLRRSVTLTQAPEPPNLSSLSSAAQHPRAGVPEPGGLGKHSRARASLLHQRSFAEFGSSGDWFMDLFGFREVDYDDTQRRLKVKPAGNLWRLEGETGRSYQAGRFSTPSLGDLEAAATAAGGQALLRGRLRVRNICGDVSEKLGNPENRHATFQVASQFNCLEYVSPHAAPEHGVTNYALDRTQGPACCIACGPGTAFRNYFAEVGGAPGQRRDRQLDNLRDISSRLGNTEGRFYKVMGGYTLATDKGLRSLSEKLERTDDKAYEALRRALRVGVHEDTQVTSTHWGSKAVGDEAQTVTQVLGSACSVSYSWNGSGLWEPFARLVLSASYEATLWAALLSALRHRCAGGSKRVFLTCLGGGVFGNETRWIVDAMHEAFSKFRNCGLEVYIVSYSQPVDRLLLELET